MKTEGPSPLVLRDDNLIVQRVRLWVRTVEYSQVASGDRLFGAKMISSLNRVAGIGQSVRNRLTIRRVLLVSGVVLCSVARTLRTGILSVVVALALVPISVGPLLAAGAMRTFGALGGSNTGDDSVSTNQALGFGITIGSTSTTTIGVSTNGFLNLNAGDSNSRCCGGGDLATQLSPMIALFWTDLYPANGNLTFGQSTLSGRNVFVAQWNGVPYCCSGPLNYLQVIVIDRSNRHAGDFDVEFNYNSLVSNSHVVTVGISEGTANSSNTKILSGANQVPGSDLADGGTNPLVNGTNVGVLGRYLFQIINGVIFFGQPNLGVLLPTNAPTNVLNVANTLDAFTNGGGTLPASFDALFALTPEQLSGALAQLSGETATGAQTGAFQLMNSFLTMMVDPTIDDGNNNGGGIASGYAAERPALPADVALAYASALKQPSRARSYSPWNVWGSVYGGTKNANGDTAVVGSHDVRTNTWGMAAGLDYRVSPDAKIGFALAGGGTNWGLSSGLGGGKSDAFQAGIYGLKRWGQTYISGALGFSSYWVSTDRTAFAGDQLTAKFNAYGIGGRLEGGYRFAMPMVGFTPYAAVQTQKFHTPSYSETDLTGGGFGLTYNSHNATATRTELGTRLDKQVALNNGAVLGLRGRVAWAHDSVTDPSLTAAFQAVPGSGFVVNGATPARNSALVTGGAEIKLASGWAVMAKLDGEFASGSRTYTGTGKLRYSW